MSRSTRHPFIGRRASAASRCLVLAGALLLATAPVGASEVRTTLGASGSNAEPLEDLSAFGAEAGAESVELSLEDAIAIALERNLSLDVQRYRRGQAAEAIREAFGVYDLNIGASGSFAENTVPVTDALTEAEGSVTNESIDWSASLSQVVSTGGVASFRLTGQRSSTNNRNQIFNPSLGASFNFGFNQPLLRNLGRTVTEQGITISRNNSAISREDFQVQVESVVQQVINAYWSLVESREQLAVAEESLALAKELHEMNRIQVDVGTLAPLEMVQSEAGVATREEDIIRFQAQVEDNADLLRQLLNFGGGELWFVDLMPTTEPETEHRAIDVRQAVSKALGNRPDIRRQELVNKNLTVLSEVARNQKKPQLDFDFGYGVFGTEGTVTVNEMVLQDTDYFDAIDTALGGDFNGWSASLTFAYPLQNRAAESRSVQADLALEEGQAQLRTLKQQVYTDVRRASRAVETAAKQIESARVSSRLARENLEAEQKRYENGLSTSFQVLQIQEDLSAARSRQVSAILAYRRALADYHLELGELLSENEITLRDEGPEVGETDD